MTGDLVIMGCTRRKAPASTPIPAYLLYQGGLVPALRNRLGIESPWWDAVRFLSARHGLIHARHRIDPYDQPLTATITRRLRPVVHRQLGEAWARNGPPNRLLVICERSYLDLLGERLCAPAFASWVDDIRAGWPRVADVLDSWGWP